MKPKELYKTTIVIWTDYNPSTVELDDLGYEATNGAALCTTRVCEKVTDQSEFPSGDFFDGGQDDYDD